MGICEGAESADALPYVRILKDQDRDQDNTGVGRSISVARLTVLELDG